MTSEQRPDGADSVDSEPTVRNTPGTSGDTSASDGSEAASDGSEGPASLEEGGGSSSDSDQPHPAGPAARPYARRHDWPPVKRRYVEGVPSADGTGIDWPSLDQVAAHFGIYATRVREKAAQEGWRAARAQWQAQVERTRQQARAAALSREGTELDNRALGAAKLGLQLCMARLAEIGQLQQQARAANVGGPGGAPAVDAQEQQRLAQAVDLWHKVGLRAIGDPELHRLQITGANGGPVEIAAELRRDDPNRLSGVLGVLAQAGLGELFGSDPKVLEGVVEDGSG